jgi:hypothetical protein
MQIDANKLMWSAFYLHWMWSAPLQLVICTYLLYQQLGPAAFVSLGIMLAMGPINVFVMKVAVKFQRLTMERRDTRVKILTELLQVENVLENVAAMVEDVAAMVENVAAMVEDVAAVVEDVAAMVEDVAAMVEDVAALVEDVAAVVEYVAAVVENEAAVVEDVAAMWFISRATITIIHYTRYPLALLVYSVYSVYSATISTCTLSV